MNRNRKFTERDLREAQVTLALLQEADELELCPCCDCLADDTVPDHLKQRMYTDEQLEQHFGVDRFHDPYKKWVRKMELNADETVQFNPTNTKPYKCPACAAAYQSFDGLFNHSFKIRYRIAVNTDVTNIHYRYMKKYGFFTRDFNPFPRPVKPQPQPDNAQRDSRVSERSSDNTIKAEDTSGQTSESDNRESEGAQADDSEAAFWARMKHIASFGQGPPTEQEWQQHLERLSLIADFGPDLSTEEQKRERHERMKAIATFGEDMRSEEEKRDWRERMKGIATFGGSR